MTVYPCQGGPPWWPAGEPWPPAGGRFRIDARTRVRFFRRVAFAAAALLVLAVSGLFAAAWAVTGRLGLAGWLATATPLFILICVAIVVAGMFGAMRRFAAPLG